MKRMAEVEVLIIGAGPAGLAAGAAALDRGRSVLVLEKGCSAAARDRVRPEDLVSGVGGAGLYSDGKFSFAPSATRLWTLMPAAPLAEAYAWAGQRLREGGLEPPAFPEQEPMGAQSSGPIKAYPSQYMPLDARERLIAALERHLGDRLVLGADARLETEARHLRAEWDGGQARARTVVIASGRFGPLRGPGWLSSTFRRVEVGMRVEQEAARFALDAGPVARLLDPKWIQRSTDERVEWRTFCCCRRGEVIETRFDGLSTVSGRADGPPTDRSNVGINVRFLDQGEATAALELVRQAAGEQPLRISASDLLDAPASSAVAERFGRMIAQDLASGLAAFAADFRADLSGAVLHLPALEGVGYYPAVDHTLKVAPGIWAAGDATGVFRGLVPALVSGRLASATAADSLERP
jgi:uncharacterized FAD-dependent dehydrogenase